MPASKPGDGGPWMLSIHMLLWVTGVMFVSSGTQFGSTVGTSGGLIWSLAGEAQPYNATVFGGEPIHLRSAYTDVLQTSIHSAYDATLTRGVARARSSAASELALGQSILRYGER